MPASMTIGHCKARREAIGAPTPAGSVRARSASAAANATLATSHQRVPRRLCCFSPTDTDAALASMRTVARATSRVGMCNFNTRKF